MAAMARRSVVENAATSPPLTKGLERSTFLE